MNFDEFAEKYYKEHGVFPTVQIYREYLEKNSKKKTEKKEETKKKSSRRKRK